LLGTAATVNVSFEWGTTHGGPYPYSTPPQAMTEPDVFHAHLGSLSSDTTYYFRARGDGGVNGTGYGEESFFTTGTIAPAVTTNDATDIGVASAVLNGNLDTVGTSGTVNVCFEWGDRQGGPYPYWTTFQAMTVTGPFQANLTELPARTYLYFRAVAVGDTVVFGAEKSFTTLSPVPPLTQHPKSSPSSSQTGPPPMTIQYININPKQASIGQTVTITANVVNPGDQATGYAADLMINGKMQQTKTVTVGPRATQPVMFTVTGTRPGTYTVDIGNQRANFIVIDTGSNRAGRTGQSVLLIASLAVIVLLAGLLTILARRRLHGY